MNWLQEAQRAMSGSLRLLFRDTGGYDEFNLTESGFWRSFTAVIPIAPLFIYSATVEIVDPATADLGEHKPLPMELVVITLVVQWFAWPLAMAFIARSAGLTHNYSRYIIAYNWSSILIMVMQLMPVLLFAMAGASVNMAVVLTTLILVILLYYRWYIALTALEITASFAWVVVLADFVLSFAITRWIS